MGYGGPRVEFYTLNQYNNYTAAIQKEDAARVRSIVQQRDMPAEREVQRQKEEEFRAYERAQAEVAAEERRQEEADLEERKRRDEQRLHRTQGKVQRRSLTGPERAAQRTRKDRIAQLAKPKDYGEAQYGGFTHGLCLHQRGRGVPFPEGRNHAPYMPGVDRDRLMPTHPTADDIPPWVGSYSTHHGEGQAARTRAKEEMQYYLHASSNVPKRSAAEQKERAATIKGIAARHAKEVEGNAAASTEDRKENLFTASAAQSCERDYDDDNVSVFSHGSSNGPIEATGNQHMTTLSTKDTTRAHLSNYGGAMTAPRPTTRASIPLEGLTLPELSGRIVRMQNSMRKI